MNNARYLHIINTIGELYAPYLPELLKQPSLRQDFEYVLARRRQEAAEEQERIMSSVSYGFLLMLIGIVIVVVVLLAHRT